MRLLAVVLVVLASSGCLEALGFEPVHTFDPGLCGTVPTTQLVVGVVGTDERLVRARLVASRGVYPMLSCVGPNPEQALASTNGVTAVGRVDAQLYEELDVFFNASVVRVQARMPLDHDGTLILDLGGPEPRVTWRRQNVSVDRSERLTPAHAIEPITRSWTRTTAAAVDETIWLNVTTGWNEGLRATLFAYRSAAESDSAYVPTMRIDLKAPNGTVQPFRQRDDLPMALEMQTPPLPAGAWSLRIRTGEPPQAQPVRLDFHMVLSY